MIKIWKDTKDTTVGPVVQPSPCLHGGSAAPHADGLVMDPSFCSAGAPSCEWSVLLLFRQDEAEMHATFHPKRNCRISMPETKPLNYLYPLRSQITLLGVGWVAVNFPAKTSQTRTTTKDVRILCWYSIEYSANSVTSLYEQCSVVIP